jgi:hypothetical protein
MRPGPTGFGLARAVQPIGIVTDRALCACPQRAPARASPQVSAIGVCVAVAEPPDGTPSRCAGSSLPSHGGVCRKTGSVIVPVLGRQTRHDYARLGTGAGVRPLPRTAPAADEGRSAGRHFCSATKESTSRRRGCLAAPNYLPYVRHTAGLSRHRSAEVRALRALIISGTTETERNLAGESVTTITEPRQRLRGYLRWREGVSTPASPRMYRLS